jgi:hypothetical protein
VGVDETVEITFFGFVVLGVHAILFGAFFVFRTFIARMFQIYVA